MKEPKFNVAHTKENLPATTVNIPDELHAGLKLMAAQKGTTISGEAQDAIALQLAEHRKLCRNGGRMPQRKAKA